MPRTPLPAVPPLAEGSRERRSSGGKQSLEAVSSKERGIKAAAAVLSSSMSADAAMSEWGVTVDQLKYYQQKLLDAGQPDLRAGRGCHSPVSGYSELSSQNSTAGASRTGSRTCISTLPCTHPCPPHSRSASPHLHTLYPSRIPSPPASMLSRCWRRHASQGVGRLLPGLHHGRAAGVRGRQARGRKEIVRKVRRARVVDLRFQGISNSGSGSNQIWRAACHPG